jgi:hypothetical protein
MGDKVSALVAALALVSIVLAYAAPVFAQDGDQEPTLPPDEEPPGDQDTGTTTGPPEPLYDNNADNQSSPGAWPISPMLTVAIVGVVIIAAAGVGAWKYLSSRPKKDYQPELPETGAPDFSLPLHKL